MQEAEYTNAAYVGLSLASGATGSEKRKIRCQEETVPREGWMMPRRNNPVATWKPVRNQEREFRKAYRRNLLGEHIRMTAQKDSRYTVVLGGIVDGWTQSIW